MRDVEITLHHRAGAADLVADQRADMRQQQIVQRALDPIALGLVGRGDRRARRAARLRRASAMVLAAARILSARILSMCGETPLLPAGVQARPEPASMQVQDRRQTICLQRKNSGASDKVAREARRPARSATPVPRNQKEATRPTLLVAIDLLALLVALLRLHRQRRDRTGFQPLQRDRLAGLLAIAVGVVLDALQRRVDLGDQLALAVAGAQFDRAVGFGRGAVGEIGVIDVLFLQGLQRELRLRAGSRPSMPAAWRENNRAGGRS